MAGLYYVPQFFKYTFFTKLFSVPKFTVLDGFGRNLNDQFYQVGSSLEICCQVRQYF